MIKDLPLLDSHAALRLILEANLQSLNRLFVDFHNMMKKANEDGVKPDPVPQDRANHILDLMLSLQPFLELMRKEFILYHPVIQWCEENCKRILKDIDDQPTSPSSEESAQT